MYINMGVWHTMYIKHGCLRVERMRAEGREEAICGWRGGYIRVEKRLYEGKEEGCEGREEAM
jgi:hypothetical protein